MGIDYYFMYDLFVHLLRAAFRNGVDCDLYSSVVAGECQHGKLYHKQR